MRPRNSWLTILVAATIASFCLAPVTARAELRDSDREETWEFSIPIRFVSSESLTADGGSTVDINSDVSWGFAFGYNLNEQFNVGFEFTWMDANYDATIQSGDVPPPEIFPITIGGTLEATSGVFTGQYNFMAKAFTPFVSAGLGWTWVDSNIPVGPAEGVCWWDPWWGYICDVWQPTASDTSFGYSLGAGVRGELAEAFYVEASYSYTWIDFDNIDTTDFSGVRLDMGWKF